MTPRLVVATGNPHKLDEIARLLGGSIPEIRSGSVELVAMTDLGVPPPVEDGDTFEANALIKARAVAAATGLPALADDSGLEVDALDGAPGVRSARYAGDDASDADNNAALVAALADVPEDERTARFVCVAALVTVDGREVTRRGTMEGRVVDQPRGDQGFGYDPYFVADATDGGRTNGQLAPAEKDTISHRGAAFRALAEDVARLLDPA
ncbi:RdgB/HAM1 family non-canonical purine NTP pyrophosphatase [Nitriliruptor alkaliphilus]|uniref:RdgB/HAM1 family non-canonical purine NTP pyrophosphatase n=1 Tax=Nitriliruptor alkaliphilus TaxID=427918 RepID=UPI00069681EF|nr:RdgB/HAM1 family non-canonical purine NTP pyrophosphatase [Nitriliruptor alkaliphilus]